MRRGNSLEALTPSNQNQSLASLQVKSQFQNILRGFVHFEHLEFLVFKVNVNDPNFWYLSRGTFTNLNIFGSLLPVENIEERTSGGEGCDSPGDYLR